MSERRTNRRLLLHSPVEVSGIDESGFQFVEQTRLEDAGDAGCRFSTRNLIRPATIFALQLLGPDGEPLPEEYPRLFIVVWVKREAGRRTVGARCLLGDGLSGPRLTPQNRTSKISTE